MRELKLHMKIQILTLMTWKLMIQCLVVHSPVGQDRKERQRFVHKLSRESNPKLKHDYHTVGKSKLNFTGQTLRTF